MLDDAGFEEALRLCPSLDALPQIARSYFRRPEFGTAALIELVCTSFQVTRSFAHTFDMAGDGRQFLSRFIDGNETQFHQHFLREPLLFFERRSGEGHEAATALLGVQFCAETAEALFIRQFQQGGRMGIAAIINRHSTGLRAVIDDIRLVASDLLERMMVLSAEREKAEAALSKREVECLKWAARGKTSAETALILGLSEHTINNYINSACNKLKAVNRAHAVAKLASLPM